MKAGLTISQAIEAGHDEGTAARVVALCQHLDCAPEDIEELQTDNYGMPLFAAGGGEYAVATDEEADRAWDQDLESYIDECIEPEIEKAKATMGGGITANYLTFDREGWKEAAQDDGRGHSLNRYNGAEDEETVINEEDESEETFYIYRTN